MRRCSATCCLCARISLSFFFAYPPPPSPHHFCRDDAPGLLFLTPCLWESADKMKACAERLKSAGIAKLPKRSCPEGYKERLRRWVEQQPGKLDSRAHHPEMWEDWVYKKGKRGSASTNNGSE